MSQLSSLLLLDTDPRGLETLTYGFEREGCTVTATSDLGRAADLLRTTSPQLAVVSLRDHDSAGLDLLKTLRSTLGGSAGGGPPVVTLGPPALKAAALAAGASDFLATPLFVRDVISVGKLLTLGQGARSEAKHDAAAAASAGTGADAAADGDDGVVEIESRLSEYHGLFYLLRLMAVTGRSGILALTRGTRRAELRFSEGTVVAAHVAGLQGLHAVHNVLLWEEAALSFKFRPIPRQAQLPLSSAELLDECERFLRDLAFNARELGPPRIAYLAVANHDTSASGLQPSELGPVLRLFDGQRTLLQAIEESPFSIFDTIRVVKRLLDTGALAAQGSTGDEGPRSLLEPWAIAPDAQGTTIGERRQTRRRLKPVRSDEPQAIVLTTRKASGSGPIRKRGKTPPPLMVTGPAAPAPAPALAPAPPPPRGDFAYDPTVQVKVDAAGMPVAAPLVAASPAPLTALEPKLATPPPMLKTPPPMLRTPAPMLKTPAPVPQRRRTTGPRAPLEPGARTPPPHLKEVPAAPRLTPSTAFDAVEADFFAREKDLYTREKVESFEDLEPTSDSDPYLTRPPKKKR